MVENKQCLNSMEYINGLEIAMLNAQGHTNLIFVCIVFISDESKTLSFGI